MAPAVLPLNAGLVEPENRLVPPDHGRSFAAHPVGGGVLADRRRPDPDTGFADLSRAAVDWIEAHLGGDPLMAAGHRIVRGGPDHHRPERVTPALLAALDRLTPLAPLHMPKTLAPIRAVAAARPDLPRAEIRGRTGARPGWLGLVLDQGAKVSDAPSSTMLAAPPARQSPSPMETIT